MPLTPGPSPHEFGQRLMSWQRESIRIHGEGSLDVYNKDPVIVERTYVNDADVYLSQRCWRHGDCAGMTVTTLGSRLRGNDGSLRGNDGSLRGNDGSLHGDDGSLHGNDGSLHGEDGDDAGFPLARG
jgi:hypothetical protein